MLLLPLFRFRTSRAELAGCQCDLPYSVSLVVAFIISEILLSSEADVGGRLGLGRPDVPPDEPGELGDSVVAVNDF